jgi:hypothetical protein
MVSDASEDIESARTRQEGVGTIFAFLFPNSDALSFVVGIRFVVSSSSCLAMFDDAWRRPQRGAA